MVQSRSIEESHTSEIGCASGENSNQENNIENSASENNELYSYEELCEKKLEEIKKIAKRNHITIKGNKQDMINKILEAQQIDDDDFTRLMEDLIESSKKGKAQHHKDYKSFFNGVDLQDTYWYSIQGHHYFKKWQSKLVNSLLEVCMVNAFTLYSEKVSGMTMSEFADKVTNKMCQKNFKI